jgi:hypothetical protein
VHSNTSPCSEFAFTLLYCYAKRTLLSDLQHSQLLTPLTYNYILTLMIMEQSETPMTGQCSTDTYELICPVALP